ncbi:MAG TPA: LegC family aminotransferase [Clostridia bacterium]|nr:LegC family aminotransferase [Clostridia bacterium]
MKSETNVTPSEVVAVLKKVLKKGEGPIALHEPLFIGREWEYVKDCLDSGYVSSVGRYVESFEKNLAHYTESRFAIAVASGTAAMHICLKLIGVGQGDEVLVPALTFIATANAVCYCGAVPHFIDCSAESLGVDPKKLDSYLKEITVKKDGLCYNRLTMRPIKAVVAMHTFGHPVDLEPLLEVCKLYSIELVEDAAESLGSYYKNKHTGNFGKLSAVSFNGNKIVTTGGGGAILTNDEILAKEAKHISTTAKLPHRWAFVHDQVGYNYRMPNINAALGCAQLEQLDRFVRYKRTLAEKYRLAFENMPGITFFKEPAYARSNYWLNTCILSEENASIRDEILAQTNDAGLMTRPVWALMNKLTIFQECPHMDLSTAEKLERCIINIPSSACLGEA